MPPKRITEKLERRARRAARRKEREERRDARRRAVPAVRPSPTKPKETPLAAAFRANQAALDLIRRYGLVDGEHHKNWVLDEVVKTLCGWADDPVGAYEFFVDGFDESESDSDVEPENGWREMLRNNCTPP